MPYRDIGTGLRENYAENAPERSKYLWRQCECKFRMKTKGREREHQHVRAAQCDAGHGREPNRGRRPEFNDGGGSGWKWDDRISRISRINEA